MPQCQKIRKKIFYLILKHKKPSFISTQAHFDVLRMLITAQRRFGLPSKSGRLVSAQRRLIASRGSLPHMTHVQRSKLRGKCCTRIVPSPIFFLVLIQTRSEPGRVEKSKALLYFCISHHVSRIKLTRCQGCKIRLGSLNALQLTENDVFQDRQINTSYMT